MSRKYRCVLASQSPRRKQLLKFLNINFDIVISHSQEVTHETRPEKMCTDIALQKALIVWEKVKHQKTPPLVIAADTMVFLEEESLAKPATAEEAREMLNKLSGKIHHVFTGVALVYTALDNTLVKKIFYEKTEVKFIQLTPQMISDYLATGESMDKAGGYGIQGQALAALESITGCYSNVVGLPLPRLLKQIREDFGGDCWPESFEI